MFSALANSFKIPELRDRILFTMGVLFVTRIITVIPMPGVDAGALRSLIDDIQSDAGGGFLGIYNLFSGGALENCSIGSLGIMPYISASIILQLMTAVIPQLERLAREGDAGRQKLTQYTRYLTVLLCAVQGWAMVITLRNPGAIGIQQNIVTMTSPVGFTLIALITMTTGTMLLMWLGEQITARGIGNGVSMIITVGIVSRLPGALRALIDGLMPGAGGEARLNLFHLVSLIAMLFVVVAAVVAMTQAQRKIPVQYARRVVGNKVYGGQSTYMPLRVNYSGVMPIIFAQSILMFPPKLLQRINNEAIKDIGNALEYGTPAYMVLFTLMILFFSYFWVATQFRPVQIADDLKKYGGYVPGIRPGTPTAEFLDRSMTRITLAGAVFLTAIATLPSLLTKLFGVPWLVASFFGGTSLLIIVGVMLDTMRQIESYLLMRHYDGFLRKGRMRGRA